MTAYIQVPQYFSKFYVQYYSDSLSKFFILLERVLQSTALLFIFSFIFHIVAMKAYIPILYIPLFITKSVY